MGRMRWVMLLTAAVCVGVMAGPASSALAASSRVRVGLSPRLPAGSNVVGSLPGATRVDVAVTLEPRDSVALAAYATAVSTPGSSVYHHYLSVAQFARRFGATPATIAAVESALRAAGLDPQPATANGLAIPVAATTAGELAQAFSISFERVAVPGGRTAFTNTSPPALAASVAGDVQGVLGLDSLALARPLGLHRAPSARRAVAAHAQSAAAPHVLTGGPQPCTAAQSAATAGAGDVGYTADQIAAAYRYPSLYGAGDLGAGQTVGIYELEGNFHGDITGFQNCYGTSASVAYQTVDGGPPAPTAGHGDGIETELDIEGVIGLAPRANIIVYQGPNGGGATNQGPYLTYSAMITANVAKVISSSWGLCEPLQDPGAANSESTLFQEAATQGQSIFAAAGDNGAEDCSGSSPNSAIAVDDPGSQPFVTSVGGASLNAVGPPPSQTTWNDSATGNGAGGGGISTVWPMPSYQSGAPASLNVINANSSRVPCAAPTGSYCREVPDVAGATSAAGEYAVYWNGNGTGNDANWIGIWGTSWAAPQWAALAAEANASSACGGTPIGFANPLLYRVAGSSAYPSAFTDITSGSNAYSPSGNPSSLYPSGPGFDMASGMGTPIASTLAGYLCDHVTVGNPGSQISFTGTPVNVAVPGTSTGGATLSYTATGLPAGLSIDPATGAVSGTPATAGTSSATVSVTSSDGLSGSTSFSWTVFATSVGVAAIGGQAGTVGVPVPALEVHASADNGGAITYSATGLPVGLSIGAASGLITGTPTAAGTSTVTVKATDATGPSATTSFSWAIVAAAAFSHGSLSGLGKGKPKLSFTIAAASGAPSIKTIVIGLPAGLSFSGKAKKLAKGIVVKGLGAKSVKFSAKVSHGELTINLSAPAPSVKVTISGAALAESKSLEKRVKHKHLRSLTILVQATGAGNTTTGVVAKLTV
jgi:subtilase family serine protease